MVNTHEMRCNKYTTVTQIIWSKNVIYTIHFKVNLIRLIISNKYVSKTEWVNFKMSWTLIRNHTIIKYVKEKELKQFVGIAISIP